MKKILFIGTTSLSLSLVKKLNNHPNLRITGIITGETDFKISYAKQRVHNYNYEDLTMFANFMSIPSFKMTQGMNDSKLKKWVSQQSFDLVLVAGWFHMIPKDWLANYKCLGIHASLLPRYRGGAPLVWALINGETETGVSLFLMDSGVDTGRVLFQKKITITEQETISTLLKKVEECTIKLCFDHIPFLETNQLLSTDSTHNEGMPFPQRSPEDGEIKFPMSMDVLSRFIRAQSHPYPGAYLVKNQMKLYLWGCGEKKTNVILGNPNDIFLINNKIEIQCVDGTLSITECLLLDGEIQVDSDEEIFVRWNS